MRLRDIFGFALAMVALCWVVVASAQQPPPTAPTQTSAQILAARTPDLPQGYAIRQSIALHKKTYGIDGTLEVLEDAHVTPALQKAMWRVTADPRFVLADNDPHRALIEKDPLRMAHVRLVTHDGRILFEDKFVWPLAEIEVAPLTNGGNPVIFVTTDNTTSFGSYKGTATRLLEFHRAGAKAGDKDRAPAYASIGEDPKPALLIRSQKSDWRLAKNARGEDVIHLINAYPDVNGNINDFIIEYSTIAADEGGWNMRTYTGRGVWEPQEAWPPAAKFP